MGEDDVALAGSVTKIDDAGNTLNFSKRTHDSNCQAPATSGMFMAGSET